MLVIKAFHIVIMVAWFSGLFYLPRLFVYHSQTQDVVSLQRFEIMERRLYYGITWPAAIITTVLGIILLLMNPLYYLKVGWMHAKLALVVLVWIYHLACGHFRKNLARQRNCKTVLFYKIFNEIPLLLLLSIVLLVVVKPF